MQVKATRNVNHDGTLYTEGTLFEVNEADGQALVEVGAAVQVEVAKPVVSQGPSYDELKARAKELGLAANGSRDALIERIAEAEDANAAKEAEDEADAQAAEEEAAAKAAQDLVDAQSSKKPSDAPENKDGESGQSADRTQPEGDGSKSEV
ncbi:SAP domain-containing protein [Streptomyces sp. NPDC058469]|uniref:SAP domain-containing protein n=1 Tax=Streptomyces sp. NPDC058469 TaxID=3346514 RepID=UPI003662F519